MDDISWIIVLVGWCKIGGRGAGIPRKQHAPGLKIKTKDKGIEVVVYIFAYY